MPSAKLRTLRRLTMTRPIVHPCAAGGFIVLAMAAICMAAATASAQPTLEADPSTTEIAAGQGFVVDFTLTASDDETVSDVTFQAEFPPEFTVVSLPSLTDPCLESASYDNDTLSVTFGRLGFGQSCSFSLPIATDEGPFVGVFPILYPEFDVGSVTLAPDDTTISVIESPLSLAVTTAQSEVPFDSATEVTASFSGTLGSGDFLRLTTLRVSLSPGLEFVENVPVEIDCPQPFTATNEGASLLLRTQGLFSASFDCEARFFVRSREAGEHSISFGEAFVGFGESVGSGVVRTSLTTSQPGPLALVSTPGITQTALGQPVTLDYRLLNRTRSTETTGIGFTLPIPPELGANVALPEEGSCGPDSSFSFANNTITASDLRVGPASDCELSFALTATELVAETTVILSSNVSGQHEGQSVSAAPVEHYLLAPDDIVSDITIDPTTVNAGGVLEFELRIENRSTAEISDLAQAIDLSNADGLSSWQLSEESCSANLVQSPPGQEPRVNVIVPTLPAGQTCVFSLSANVDPATSPNRYSLGLVRPGTLASAQGQSPYRFFSYDLRALPAVRITPQYEAGATSTMPGGVVTLQIELITGENHAPLSEELYFLLQPGAFPPGTALVGGDTEACGGGLVSTSLPLTLDGATIEANTTCTFSVDIELPEVASRDTIALTLSEYSGTIEGEPLTLQDVEVGSLTIESLSLNLAVSPPLVSGGDSFTLTGTLTNGSSLDLTSGSGTLVLDSEMEGATLDAGSITSDCPGTPSAGGESLFLTTSLPAGDSCSFSAQYATSESTAPGDYSIGFNSGFLAELAVGAALPLAVPPARVTIAAPIVPLLSFDGGQEDTPAGNNLRATLSLTNISADSTSATDLTLEADEAASGVTLDSSTSTCSFDSETAGPSDLTIEGLTLSPEADCTLVLDVTTEGASLAAQQAVIRIGEFAGDLAVSEGSGAAIRDEVPLTRYDLAVSGSDEALTIGETGNLEATITPAGSAVAGNLLTLSVRAEAGGVDFSNVSLVDVCGQQVDASSSATRLDIGPFALEPGESCVVTIPLFAAASGGEGTYSVTAGPLSDPSATLSPGQSIDVEIVAPEDPDTGNPDAGDDTGTDDAGDDTSTDDAGDDTGTDDAGGSLGSGSEGGCATVPTRQTWPTFLLALVLAIVTLGRRARRER